MQVFAFLVRLGSPNYLQYEIHAACSPAPTLSFIKRSRERDRYRETKMTG
jgi:hypothetical protein